MDVVLPVGATCARLGLEATNADTATMPAAITNGKPRPLRLTFDDMLDSCLARHRPREIAWSNGHSADGRWPISVQILQLATYICQSHRTGRARQNKAEPSARREVPDLPFVPHAGIGLPRA